MLPSGMLASLGVSIQVLAAPLLSYLLANAPGRTVEDGQGAWALATHVGDLVGVPRSKLGTSVWITPGHYSHWGDELRYMSLSLFLPFSVILLFK